ncbi:hypothetical protein ACIO93_18545 [Streptomyces sp. NPDC087903]|uniref:hypothetical protein n=1 Tax=Streptomyces sp. NPDC087903 TaxID=3365819 RepID=UPI0038086481
MTARHTAAAHNRLLITATALVAAAALLRLVSPDAGADAAPGPHDKPSHSSAPAKATPTAKPGHSAKSTPDKPTDDRPKSPTHKDSAHDPAPGASLPRPVTTTAHPQQPTHNVRLPDNPED